ncbi:type II toxin-antitoxin system RelE/ParE family toxin [Candidatus Woesearchaeota archaeon]|nr:type II toxin-antitoxin system RelE/ParE family toxin [Candidatus Woesearchaeota archaeon]
MVEIIPSSQFKKSVKHLDAEQRNKLEKIIKKILKEPYVGKPLKYLRGERSLRIKPFRIVYAFRKDISTLYLLKFKHRDSVYD